VPFVKNQNIIKLNANPLVNPNLTTKLSITHKRKNRTRANQIEEVMEGIKVKVDIKEVTMIIMEMVKDVIKEDLKRNIALCASKNTTSLLTTH
jgi:hypothetical protein